MEAVDQSHITQEVLKEFAVIRRAVYDNQIHPNLQSTAAFLSYEQPTCQENPPVPIDVPNRDGLVPVKVVPLILVFDKWLETAISQAENDHEYGSHGMTLYRGGGYELPIRINSNVLDQVDDAHYNRAVDIFMQALQGSVALKSIVTWEEMVEAIEQAGKKAPKVPEKRILASGDDGGYLNERLAIELPTKAPHLFVEYVYRANGRIDGVPPVSKYPYFVGIQATTLDQYYPHYPYQRFH